MLYILIIIYLCIGKIIHLKYFNHMKKLVFIGCLALGMITVSCCDKGAKAGSKTIKTSEVILNEAYEMINPDSTLFSGVVWSDDGKTFMFTVIDGKPDESFTYHENGKLAIKSRHDDMGNEVNVFYDEKGKKMTEEEFMAKYESVIKRREAVWDDK